MGCNDDILHLILFDEAMLNEYLVAQKNALIPLAIYRGVPFLTKSKFILLILLSAKLPKEKQKYSKLVQFCINNAKTFFSYKCGSYNLLHIFFFFIALCVLYHCCVHTCYVSSATGYTTIADVKVHCIKTIKEKT